PLPSSPHWTPTITIPGMGIPLAFAGFAPADELALFGRLHPIEGRSPTLRAAERRCVAPADPVLGAPADSTEDWRKSIGCCRSRASPMSVAGARIEGCRRPVARSATTA